MDMELTLTAMEGYTLENGKKVYVMEKETLYMPMEGLKKASGKKIN